MTKEEFLEKAYSIHGDKYQYLNLDEKIISHEKIEMIYNKKKYTQKVVKHLMGRCPEKFTPKKTTEQFIKEAKEIWGNKYDYNLTEYKGALKHIKIIYDGVIFEQRASSHLNGLSVELKMNQEYFIKLAKEKYGNKYDYSDVIYKNVKTKVKITLKESNEIFYQTPYNHLQYSPEKISLRKTTSQFINEANKIHNNLFTYDKVEYISNQKKVIITCKKHGDFKQSPLSHLSGIGCPYCHESKGERKISIILDKHKIKYLRQYKFNDCKNKFKLPFDFYLPDFNILIEYDGIQHFEPIEYFGGDKSYNELKINDKIKTKYCKNNSIELIRIKYNRYNEIDQILEKIIY